MLTGYEQVRSVVAAIAGDMTAADDVHLVLPETGVCSTNIVADGVTSSSGCCAAPTPVTVEESSGCCGGPAPAKVDACCQADAVAKAATGQGCGCGSARTDDPAPGRVTERAGCC
jgi:hypothetical protein